jgi:hypothetical protein
MCLSCTRTIKMCVLLSALGNITGLCILRFVGMDGKLEDRRPEKTYSGLNFFVNGILIR